MNRPKSPQGTAKAQKQALLRAADELRVARRQTRAQRTLEDRAWEALKTPPLAAPALDGTAPWSAAPAPAPTRAAAAESRRSLRAQRRAQQQQRHAEDAHWRQHRRQLREQLSALPLVSMWIAILVIKVVFRLRIIVRASV